MPLLPHQADRNGMPVMSTVHNLPCCPVRLAILTHLGRVLALTLAWMAWTTASASATTSESQIRFVGPPSRLQPRQTSETGTLVGFQSVTEWSDPPTARIATEWRRILLPPGQVEEKTDIRPTPRIAPPPRTDEQAQVASDPPPAMPVLAGPSVAANPVQPTEPLVDEQPNPPVSEPIPTPPSTEPIAVTPPATPTTAGCFTAMPLYEVSTNIALPTGTLPENVARQCAAAMPMNWDNRLDCGWVQFDYHWAATCLCHQPLYFEEINAERYGYTPSRVLQPVLSAGHFFLTIPALPYLMAVERPCDCLYSLGHYRPGDCTPRRWNRLPLRIGAAVVEVGAIAGLILLIP
jgi:hypothetical protein